MLDDTIAELGIKCPKGSDFYAIGDKSPGYFGCCELDPNDSSQGGCPADLMQPATFDGDAYNKIPAQSCVGNDEDTLWYTCAGTTPPFMGCCAQNPCAKGSCPTDDLRPARLSDNKKNAAIFVGPWTTTATSSITSSTLAPSSTFPLSTSSTQASTTPTSTDTPSGSSVPAGAIAGGVIGGIAVLAGIVTLIIWLMKRKRLQRVQPQPVREYTPHHFHGPLGEPYPTGADSVAYSPSMAMSSPQSYYKPFQSYRPEHIEPVLAELPGSPAMSTPTSPPVGSPSSFGDGFTTRPPAYTSGTAAVSELDGRGK